jgi:hypothetical protein
VLYDSYRQNGTVPERTDYKVVLPRALDQQMREQAERLGAGYVSLIDILCDADGCLTRVGERPGDVTYWDGTHFTIAGSRFVAEHLPPDPFRVPP